MSESPAFQLAASAEAHRELKHLINVTSYAYERCRRCDAWKPIKNLHVPDGSPVVDTFPPIYEWVCLDPASCNRRQNRRK